jgi:hypothetical protein
MLNAFFWFSENLTFKIQTSVNQLGGYTAIGMLLVGESNCVQWSGYIGGKGKGIDRDRRKTCVG